MGNGAGEAQVEGCPGGGVNAHVGHHPADEKVFYARNLQQFVESGIAEAVGVMLGDDLFAGKGFDIFVDFHSRSARDKKCRARPG